MRVESAVPGGSSLKIKLLQVAVIGLGVGQQHLRAYLSDSRCQVRWVHDLDKRRAEEAASGMPKASAAESYQQILSDPELDIVSIASFDDDHFEQALAALQAGKHVFVEKPLARRAFRFALGLAEVWRQAPGVESGVAGRAALPMAAGRNRARDIRQDLRF
jgi:hypothetical protein